MKFKNREEAEIYTLKGQSKTCSNCFHEKLLGAFRIKKERGFYVFYSMCKSCEKKVKNLRRKERYDNNSCSSCGRESKTYLCRECHIKYKKRRKLFWYKLKKRCVDYLGGKCSKCGLKSKYYSIYDFHHIDPSTKKEGITKLINRSAKWDVIKKELDKCAVLCSNCHRVHHNEEEHNIEIQK